MPQVVVRYKRDKVAQYGLSIEELNRTVQIAFAGLSAGTVYEGERRFDLVARLPEQLRHQMNDIANLYVNLPDGNQVLLKEVADIVEEQGVSLITREDTRRRIVIGVNVRNRDVESFIGEVEKTLASRLKLPPGYSIVYGGQFENLQAAKARLSVAVPAALGLILILLYFTFGSVRQSLLIFSAVPLAAIGGILALWLRDMPFSISAGVGFIALFGVAVLNGIVLIGQFNHLKQDGIGDIRSRVLEGTHVRFRPILTTALVAALGFLPMAISTQAGAEVQKPLATVVIGGLITALLLTLLVLPVLYEWAERTFERSTEKINPSDNHA
jgi:cobalt-zinc-cadmium resistance protein CzcA